MGHRRGGKSGAPSVALCVGALLLLAAPASAQRTLSRSAYLDKLHGAWLGELIGNHSGRSFEGTYTTREPAEDAAFAWVIKTSPADPWTGDDDTAFEYLALHALETYGLRPTYGQLRDEWTQHVLLGGIYIANRQTWYLLAHGFTALDTGSYRYNMHAYAIDAQITTEMLGALAPGMRQRAIDAVERFGGMTNSGYSLHAAQFYAAAFAVAALEHDVETVVQQAQASIPHSSRSWQVIQEVRDWYAADRADGELDWRATRRRLYDAYVGGGSFGRYRYWIESTVNLGITTLALLYGQGEFEPTVQIAVLSGFDADCNAATAGGLIGMIDGYSGLPVALTGPATDAYRVLGLQGLPTDVTVTGLAERMLMLGEQAILEAGGSAGDEEYSLPVEDAVTPQAEQPDPPGPGGLVGAVQALGGTVGTGASVVRRNPRYDRDNLDSIIDGITDVRHNGHLPYYTLDEVTAQPLGGDFYQLNFSRRVRFDRLTFYEGDIVWNGINADPRAGTPQGGYFTDLTVEVHTEQGWEEARAVELSEPLDPYAYFQVIDVAFTPVWGDMIRLRGPAGGTREFTSIVELVAWGALVPADLDGDLDVDAADLVAFTACWSGPGVRVAKDACRGADLDGDGAVDQVDFGVFQRYVSGAGQLAAPEGGE